MQDSPTSYLTPDVLPAEVFTDPTAAVGLAYLQHPAQFLTVEFGQLFGLAARILYREFARQDQRLTRVF